MTTQDEVPDQTPLLQDTSAPVSTNHSRDTSFTERFSFDEGPDTIRKRSALQWLGWPVICLTLLVWLIVRETQFHFATRAPSYQLGFNTDLAALKPALQLKEVRFQGAIRSTENGTMHVPSPSVDSKGRRFVGPPSDEIDAAWSDLIYGRYVSFTDAELDWLNKDIGVPALLPLNTSDTSHIPREGFYGGPDMLHSLHCLNGFRWTLDREYYAAKGAMKMRPEDERLHLEHCLEQLRQAVLCHGDLTPVTLKPVHGPDGKMTVLLGETERVHTCRDGKAIAKAWREEGDRRGRLGAE
jgi:hypothetical protein